MQSNTEWKSWGDKDPMHGVAAWEGWEQILTQSRMACFATLAYRSINVRFEWFPTLPSQVTGS
jgi:hypothetical protein